MTSDREADISIFGIAGVSLVDKVYNLYLSRTLYCMESMIPKVT